MDFRQIQDSRNQHIVAIEHNGELRCFFKNASVQTAGVALANLRRDIAIHGESVVKFDTLELINKRVTKSGKTVYDIAEGAVHAHASGSGALSFVRRNSEGNPVQSSPQAEECIAFIRDKIASGVGVWKGSDWIIVNQGPLDRENHEHFEAVRKVERVADNALKMNEHVYSYDPTQVQGHVIPKFTFELAGRVMEIKAAGNNGALGYFLRNEAVLANPARVVWDSAEERQKLQYGVNVKNTEAAKAIASMEVDMRPNIGGKMAWTYVVEEHHGAVLVTRDDGASLLFEGDDAEVVRAEMMAAAQSDPDFTTLFTQYDDAGAFQSAEELEQKTTSLDDTGELANLKDKVGEKQGDETLYVALAKAGVAMDHHETDLYVNVTPETKAILANFSLQKSNATTFKSNIDGALMYDIPFAYEPAWAKKLGGTGFVDLKIADSGRHLGKVVDIAFGHAVQNVGRGQLVIHDLKQLSQKPEVGNVMDVNYVEKMGKVKIVEQSKGVER